MENKNNTYTNPQIESLLASILNGSASKEEILFFSEWIKDYKNEIYFDRFKDMWHVYIDHRHTISSSPSISNTSSSSLSASISSSTATLSTLHSSSKSSAKFLTYIRASKRRESLKRRVATILSSAASILLIFGIWRLLIIPSSTQIDIVDFSALNFSKDSVIIKSADGQLIKMKGIANYLTTIPMGVVDGNELSHTSDDGELSSLEGDSSIQSMRKSKSSQGNTQGVGKSQPAQTQSKSQTITTPSGERVALVLADGSKVYLTSNSYLQYPTSFTGDTREVTLKGRAYFEVKKSDTPFIVKTSDMDVLVLGTSFDVEARETSQNSSVILVEGSVKVHTNGESYLIKPDEQLKMDRSSKNTIVNSVDSKLLTMWKDGVLVVHGQNFEELVESLSSWYGVKIINRSSVSIHERFNGRFDREDIEAAMKAISISANIKYRVDSGNLIIENKE